MWLKCCWEGSFKKSTTLPSLLSFLSQKIKQKETCLLQGPSLKQHTSLSPIKEDCLRPKTTPKAFYVRKQI